MSPSGKFLLQPDGDYLQSCLNIYNLGTHDQDIGVVMASTFCGSKTIMAGSSPNALYFIGRYGHANAGGANQNPPLIFSSTNTPGHLVGIEGIIHAIGRVGSEIGNLMVGPGL